LESRVWFVKHDSAPATYLAIWDTDSYIVKDILGENVENWPEEEVKDYHRYFPELYPVLDQDDQDRLHTSDSNQVDIKQAAELELGNPMNCSNSDPPSAGADAMDTERIMTIATGSLGSALNEGRPGPGAPSRRKKPSGVPRRRAQQHAPPQKSTLSVPGQRRLLDFMPTPQETACCTPVETTTRENGTGEPSVNDNAEVPDHKTCLNYDGRDLLQTDETCRAPEKITARETGILEPTVNDKVEEQEHETSLNSDGQHLLLPDEPMDESGCPRRSNRNTLLFFLRSAEHKETFQTKMQNLKYDGQNNHLSKGRVWFHWLAPKLCYVTWEASHAPEDLAQLRYLAGDWPDEAVDSWTYPDHPASDSPQYIARLEDLMRMLDESRLE
jgi:hypothetical protein